MRADGLARAGVALGVIVLGAAWWWSLLASIEGEVFYSGDGGLKALMVRQLLDGRVVPWLALGEPEWLRALWSGGAYPFQPPFVHALNGHWYASFEWPFVVASAPGYALFGHRGLYLLPALSVLLTWVRFAQLCARLRMRPLTLAVALAVLVFATPLTFYGATFWEHAVAVALAFSGYVDLASTDLDRRSARHIRAGLTLGAAVFFRPEAIAFAVPALAAHVHPRRLRASAAGAAAFALVVGLYLLVNQALYGAWLGAHGIEALERPSDLVVRISHTLERTNELRTIWLAYMPLTWVALLVGGAALGAVGPRAAAVRRAALVLVLGLLGTAYLAPNAGGMQIGPRYLLALVPVLALVIAAGLDQLARASRVVCSVAAAVLLLVAATSAHENLTARSTRMRTSYATRILPAVRALLPHRDAGVLFGHHWAAMEMSRVIDGRPVATVGSRAGLDRAVAAMIEHGHDVLLVDGPSERRFRLEPRSRHGDIELEWTILSTEGDYSVLYGRRALSASPTASAAP